MPNPENVSNDGGDKQAEADGGGGRDRFFERPILNSPYVRSGAAWGVGRGRAAYAPNPEPAAGGVSHLGDAGPPRCGGIGAGPRVEQAGLVLDEGEGLSTEDQQYQIARHINRVRERVDEWRLIPDPTNWRVTPATARLLQHWRSHAFLRHQAVLLSRTPARATCS